MCDHAYRFFFLCFGVGGSGIGGRCQSPVRATEVRKGLADRWHECPACGASLDRDINAAINIRNRGVEALGTSVVTGGVSTAPKARRSKKPFAKADGVN